MLRLCSVPTTLAVRSQRLEPAPVLRVDVRAGLTVGYTALLLCSIKNSRRIDAVVVAQVVEADIVHRVAARLRDAVIDTAPAPRDRAVLVVHNRARAERIVAAQIAREGRDGGHDHDHFE